MKHLQCIITIVLIFTSQVFSQVTKDDCFLDKNEKVYVQLAKDVLVAGENIIYKAFLVNASSLKPSSQSKILYFEICDESNNRILFWRNNINSSGCSGQMKLPDTLKGGIYVLRAYTNWMRNFDKAYYFRADIIITNLSDKQLAVKKGSFEMPNKIQIFPEGGKLIYGIESKVGIKYPDITDKYSVLIKDSLGGVVTGKKLKNGFAVLSFAPQTQNQYYIEIADSLFTVKKELIGGIEPAGQALSISQAGNQIIFEPKGINSGKQRLMVRMRGKTLLDTLLNPQLQKLSLPAKRFPAGVLHALLLNSYGFVSSERLFYNKEQDQTRLILTGLPEVLEKENKYNFSLEIPHGEHGETFDLCMGIALDADVALLNTNKSMSLYFNCFSEISASQNLQDGDTASINDLLIATDISEYFWGNIDKKNFQCYHLMENKAYILKGRISDRVTGLAIKNTIISISYPDSIPQLNYAITDSGGNFSCLLDNKYDNRNLIIQLPYTNGTNVNVKWEFDNKNGVVMPKAKSNGLTSSTFDFIENYRGIQLVNAIFNNGLQNNDTLKPNKNIVHPFYYEKRNKINPEDFEELVNFKEIADNLLMGLSFKYKNNSHSIYLIDPERQTYFSEQATIFLNGVLFSNLDYISTLGTKELLDIEMIKSRIVYGDLTFHGIVHIRTKDGKVPAAELSDLSIIMKNEVSTEFTGLKPFNKMFGNHPDFRTLFYFDGNLKIKNSTSKDFTFNSSALSNDVLFNVQGVSSLGRIISYSFTKRVK